MTKPDPLQVLLDVFCEMIGKLAFMFGEPVDKSELAQTAAEYTMTSMEFSGAMEGQLALVVPEEMCAAIAANVLGVEPEEALEPARASDAIKEVLNVTCGHVVTAMAGERPVFRMSVPTLSSLDAGGWLAFRDLPGTVGIMVDEFPVLLRLLMGAASE